MGSHGLHFSSITVWGPQVKDWLASDEGRTYGIHILVETHVPKEAEASLHVWAKEQGWNASSTGTA